MNWPKLIKDLRDGGMTLQEIADACGFASRGAVHNLATGKQTTVTYDIGAKLVALQSVKTKRKNK